jgi:hypothetical protein
VNCPKSRVAHFYAEVSAPPIGDSTVNSSGRVSGEFSRPTNKSHRVTEPCVKQIVRNGVICIHSRRASVLSRARSWRSVSRFGLLLMSRADQVSQKLVYSLFWFPLGFLLFSSSAVVARP